MAAGTDGTPQSFLVLGVADVSSYQNAEAGAASTATMGIYTQGGTVFSAATVDWARVLATGKAQVGQITRNVLDCLRLRSITIQGLNGPCSAHPVVEGAVIQLRVDTAGMQYEIAAFICRIRDVLANLYRFKAPPYEPFTGMEFVADPLWNQIRGYVGPVPGEELMRRISRESQSLQTLFESNTKPSGPA